MWVREGEGESARDEGKKNKKIKNKKNNKGDIWCGGFEKKR